MTADEYLKPITDPATAMTDALTTARQAVRVCPPTSDRNTACVRSKMSELTDT